MQMLVGMQVLGTCTDIFTETEYPGVCGGASGLTRCRYRNQGNLGEGTVRVRGLVHSFPNTARWLIRCLVL